MSVKYIDKKFYLPKYGSSEELFTLVGKIQEYVSKHEWVSGPNYHLEGDRVHLSGTRRRSDKTDEIKIKDVNLALYPRSPYKPWNPK